MTEYIGFLRGTADAQTGLNPDEAQRTLERYIAWSEQRASEGVLVGGGGLSRSGRVIRTSGGSLTSTDGPHTEATEIVGGYIQVTAENLDQAEKIFADHPHLDYGPIELRKVGERGCED